MNIRDFTPPYDPRTRRVKGRPRLTHTYRAERRAAGKAALKLAEARERREVREARERAASAGLTTTVSDDLQSVKAPKSRRFFTLREPKAAPAEGATPVVRKPRTPRVVKVAGGAA